MTAADIWALVAAAVLLVITAVFGASESALAHVSRLRVGDLVKDGRRGAPRLARLVDEGARPLNVLLLVRTVAELLATALVAVVADRQLGDWQAILIAGVAMPLGHYVAVGAAARTLGRQHADRAALASAGIALGLTGLVGPVADVLIGLGGALIPGTVPREAGLTSEAELRDLVDRAEQSQVIESSEREMIHSVFELGETLAREVMVPRTDMVWIEETKTVRQALSLALRSGFSRIPVVGENEDDIVGVVYLKDLARRTHEGDGHATDRVSDVMRTPYFIPDSKPVDELLREMQSKQVHVAIVIDEYGGTAGLVTIEDILEEIVGEIADEYDREAPRIEELDDGAIRVNVRLPVDDLEELFGVSFDLDDVETVGGLLAAELGRVPIPGASVEVQGLTLVAEGAKGRRNQVGSVVIRRTTGPPGGP